jgi:hypothetical protein
MTEDGLVLNLLSWRRIFKGFYLGERGFVIKGSLRCKAFRKPLNSFIIRHFWVFSRKFSRAMTALSTLIKKWLGYYRA